MIKKKNNNDCLNKKRNIKCYKCGGKVEQKVIEFPNSKWGGGEKHIENANANVCSICGEITFSAVEAGRLLELSKTY